MIRHLTPEIVHRGGLRARRDLKAVLKAAHPVKAGDILSARQVTPGVWVAVHLKEMQVGPRAGGWEQSTRPGCILRRYNKRIKSKSGTQVSLRRSSRWADMYQPSTRTRVRLDRGNRNDRSSAT